MTLRVRRVVSRNELMYLQYLFLPPLDVFVEKAASERGGGGLRAYKHHLLTGVKVFPLGICRTLDYVPFIPTHTLSRSHWFLCWIDFPSIVICIVGSMRKTRTGAVVSGNQAQPRIGTGQVGNLARQSCKLNIGDPNKRY